MKSGIPRLLVLVGCVCLAIPVGSCLWYWLGPVRVIPTGPPLSSEELRTFAKAFDIEIPGSSD